MMSILMFDPQHAATSALIQIMEVAYVGVQVASKCRTIILLGGPLACGCVGLCQWLVAIQMSWLGVFPWLWCRCWNLHLVVFDFVSACRCQLGGGGGGVTERF
jgi:hypothetical protein